MSNEADPASMAPEERRSEIASLLGAALLRFRADGRCPAKVSPAQRRTLGRGEIRLDVRET